ncbi:4Fe-4S binding protein [Nevskia sp.]|uniref:ferredoxin family protein n=1 Tax=Nevskia sp. TaxID=1929292 RepID=UPI003F72BD34
MPHVVTDHCTACRYTECVALCPVDCFHAADDRLYIDPDACIDCAACVPVCPVKAIVDAFDLEDGADALIALNRTMSGELPVIADKAAPLPTAEARRASLGY